MLQELFHSIGLPILSAIIEPLLLLIVPPIVTWFGVRWQALTGRELDHEYSEQLHRALENGVKIGWRRYGMRAFGPERDELVTSFAADYAQRHNRGAVKRFKLPSATLRELAEAHLPPR